MTQPIINSKNQLILDNLINNLPQSLLLTGEAGVGVGTIAKYIASELDVTPTIVLPESKEKIDIEKGVIGIDSIRRLYSQTKTKSTNKRIIIIDYAERMAARSQNAFLKLLEEPGNNTYFILATHSPQKLLPTIMSRVHAVTFLPITMKQSELMLDEYKITDPTKRQQLLFMATGLPAEITRLVQSEDYFESRSNIIRDARSLLSGRTYQKLLVAHKYKDNRQNALTLLIDTSKIIKKSISDNPKRQTISRIDNVLEAYKRIEGNGNIRLCLARLVLQ